MASTPKIEGPIFLSQQNINDKFVELDMLRHLNSTCTLRSVTIPQVTIYLPIIRRPRWTDWRGESFIRKTDDECRAIIHWRKTLTGDVSRVILFLDQSDAFYVVDDFLRVHLGL